MAEQDVRDEVIQGQPQADKEAVTDPHDGKVRVRESSFKGDEAILDPNADNAVQTPAAGSSVARENPLTASLAGEVPFGGAPSDPDADPEPEAEPEKPKRKASAKD